MTITKAQILTEAKARTGRGDVLDNIDDELLLVLQDIATKVPGILQKSGVLTVSAGTTSVAEPTDMVDVDAIIDANLNGLEKITFGELMGKMNVDNDAQDNSECFAIHANKVYVWPRPITEQTLAINYRYEDTSVDTITLPDCARLALIEGTCHQIEAGLGALGAIPEQAITHLSLYNEQIAALQARYESRSR